MGFGNEININAGAATSLPPTPLEGRDDDFGWCNELMKAFNSGMERDVFHGM